MGPLAFYGLAMRDLRTRLTGDGSPTENIRKTMKLQLSWGTWAAKRMQKRNFLNRQSLSSHHTFPTFFGLIFGINFSRHFRSILDYACMIA